ncbi:MAG: acyl-CoA thioesterase [Deltaproteobacteria bacterium]|nr:acyl-CoA thioesterase [Deltaproteobacteria bacterium]
MGEEKFRFNTEIKVYFRDIDAMGHVNNAAYLSYLEIGRMEYFETLFGKNGFERFPFIIGEIHIKYHSPALLKEILLIEVRTGKIGTKSFELEYRISEKKSGRLVVEAMSKQVMFDYRNQKSIEVSEEFKRLTSRWENS